MEYIIVGVSCLLLLIAALLYIALVKPRNQNLKAEDMAEIEAEIRRSLGLGDKNKLAEGDLGLNLAARGDLSLYADNGDEESLLDMMAKFLGPELDKMPGDISLVSVDVDLASQMFNLVINDASGKLDADAAASLLNDSLTLQPLTVWLYEHQSAAVLIVSASIAMERKIVREIPAHQLQRIEALGSGNFAEVFLCQLDESKTSNIPAYSVATKVQRSEGVGNDSARTDLLREGALMALLDHPNLVKIVGIVTKPRDMPVVLVMQLCARGSLDKFLGEIAGSGETLDLRVGLTFSADVTRGLEHLTNRHIIHRDVAARNVMLDSTYCCKLGDFGMSHSVSEQKDYIRLSDELPVRWAAPEVLLEQKFSRASDVWAFGCCMHEIFSLGTTPYHELDNNLEVMHSIKAGNQPQRHQLCQSEVYEDLLRPCWAFKPKDRPSYRQLISIITLYGGEDAFAEHGDSSGSESDASDVEGMDAFGDDTDAADEVPPSEIELQAPSIFHLAGTFLDGVRHAYADAIDDPERKKSCAESVEETAVWSMVELYAKPAGASVVCPRDGALGCAYVDTLHGDDDVGSATALLSYGWANNVNNVVEALSHWSTRHDHDPKRSYIWICSLCESVPMLRSPRSCGGTSASGDRRSPCQPNPQATSHNLPHRRAHFVRSFAHSRPPPNPVFVFALAVAPAGLNQHRIKEVISPEDLKKEFRPRVRAIGRILPFLDPWSSPVYITRAWVRPTDTHARAHTCSHAMRTHPTPRLRCLSVPSTPSSGSWLSSHSFLLCVQSLRCSTLHGLAVLVRAADRDHDGAELQG